MELLHTTGGAARRIVRRAVAYRRRNRRRRGGWHALSAAFVMGLAAGALVTGSGRGVPAAAFSRGEAVLVRVTAPAAVRAVAATLGSDLRPASAIAPAGRARPPRHAKTFRARRTAARRWDTHVRARPLKGQFKRYFRMTATAYTPINTRMEGGRFTKTQRDGRGAHGMAVDPDLIPLGSRLWIPGYGHAVADDTGGRIQGHRVDLRMQSARQMRAWGVKRAVRVYVLQDP